MSSLVNALDNFTPKQLGENAHAEHGWSNAIEEEIAQLFFQLTRTSSVTQMNSLSDRFVSLIKRATQSNEKYFETLCKLAAQTRDIEDGKGEYRLGWYLINAFDKAGHSHIAKRLIYWSVTDLPVEKLVELSGVSESSTPAKHPFGSWKDIKYLWSQFQWSSDVSNFMIKLMNKQIRTDYDTLLESKRPPTLVGRWAPRESSQFKKMFRYLALDYFSEYINSAKDESSRARAKKKAYKDYRAILAALNKGLSTVQVHQCAGTWSAIDYDKDVTSVTLTRQGMAFRNKTKRGAQRSSDPDRIEAADKFKDWLSSKVRSGETIKGSRVGLNELVAKALCWHSYDCDQSTKDQLNLQWADGSKKIGDLGDMIAMVDTSGSMSGTPINAAVGLGMRVAEHSRLGRRVMTFSATPKWIQLPDVPEGSHPDFVSDAKMIANDSSWGMNTNFTAALKMILDAAVGAKLSNEQVGKLTLAIFSDMQIDYHGNESLDDSMWEHITKLYNAAGYTKVPHILFWNLRSTSGFPVLSKQKGASMLSGFSPALLNAFCDKGIEFLDDCSPWSVMNSLLDNPRYCMFNKLTDLDLGVDMIGEVEGLTKPQEAWVTAATLGLGATNRHH